ncbi:hypothetical protein ACTXT7_015493 [Hymenolepis weldensis]
MEAGPVSSNENRLHAIKLSRAKIGWPRIFIMSHHTYGHLTHQTLIHWIITRGAGRGVVEMEVNKHPYNTKSSSLMEAVVQGMEDINKGYLIKACSRFELELSG